jgi:hypothetical protein
LVYRIFFGNPCKCNVGHEQLNANYSRTEAENPNFKNRKLADMQKHRIFSMSFASVYRLYIEKVEKKGRTKEDVDTVVCWLTGYDKESLGEHIEKKTDFETFFGEAQLNPHASKITGMICGHRIEEIEDPLMKKIRYLDKLVDELAKGKKMESILRK